MEVSIIFQSESKIDENNNFDVEFKNENEIIEIIFRKNRDYYLANATAFVKNNYDKEIVDLHNAIQKLAKQEHPIPEEIKLDYTRPTLKPIRLEKYKYRLEKTSKNYKKMIKYFDVDKEKLEEFEASDALSQVRDGITYKPKKPPHRDEMYTEIKFKLTSSRKIEIRLTDSVNQGIRAYYYYWMNTIFTKKGTSWYSSDSTWFQVAYYDYTNYI